MMRRIPYDDVGARTFVDCEHCHQGYNPYHSDQAEIHSTGQCSEQSTEQKADSSVTCEKCGKSYHPLDF